MPSLEILEGLAKVRNADACRLCGPLLVLLAYLGRIRLDREIDAKTIPRTWEHFAVDTVPQKKGCPLREAR
jgi:hypothetical protein